ncbi:MAG: hypothetical protein QOD31_3135, partial [Pseudonocardiales bacterium]|nr:hypothetical protein [Pseudonocardiales bacterium]
MNTVTPAAPVVSADRGTQAGQARGVT